MKPQTAIGLGVGILLAGALVASCVANDGAASTPTNNTAQYKLYMYPDSVHGVMCYSNSGYKDLSCVKVQP